MSNWFNIRALDNGNPQLLIEGVIGWWPVIAEEFRYQLNEYDDAAPVEVRIDSIGGDPLTAKSIYNMLVQREGEVTIVIENNCLSAATMIACAGDTVIMHDLGVYMIHEPEIFPDEWMREDDAQSILDQVRITKQHMIEIYSAFTGIGKDEVAEMMKATTWMNAQEALDNGFAHEIREVIPQIEADDSMDMAARAYNVPKRFSNGGPKTLPENDKSKTKATTMNWLKSLKNTFSLGDDSDEADVVLSAKELKNENTSLKADNSDLQEDLDEIKKERDALKEKLDKFQADEEAEEEEEIEAVLTAMVDNFQIKAADKDELTEEYADNLKGLKALQKRIPEGAVKNGTSSKVQAKSKGLAATGVGESVSKYFNN